MLSIRTHLYISLGVVFQYRENKRFHMLIISLYPVCANLKDGSGHLVKLGKMSRPLKLLAVRALYSKHVPTSFVV